jgi:DnaJ-class molecular chaperone
MQTQSPALRRCPECRGHRTIAFGRYCPKCGGFGYVHVLQTEPATLHDMALAAIFIRGAAL